MAIMYRGEDVVIAGKTKAVPQKGGRKKIECALGEKHGKIHQSGGGGSFGLPFSKL